MSSARIAEQPSATIEHIDFGLFKPAGSYEPMGIYNWNGDSYFQSTLPENLFFAL